MKNENVFPRMKRNNQLLFQAAGNYDTEIIIGLINQAIKTSGSSIKSQVLDLKTLPIFSPLKMSVNWLYTIIDLLRKAKSLELS